MNRKLYKDMGYGSLRVMKRGEKERREGRGAVNNKTYLPSWFLDRSSVLSCEHFHLLGAGREEI